LIKCIAPVDIEVEPILANNEGSTYRVRKMSLSLFGRFYSDYLVIINRTHQIRLLREGSYDGVFTLKEKSRASPLV